MVRSLTFQKQQGLHSDFASNQLPPKLFAARSSELNLFLKPFGLDNISIQWKKQSRRHSTFVTGEKRPTGCDQFVKDGLCIRNLRVCNDQNSQVFKGDSGQYSPGINNQLSPLSPKTCGVFSDFKNTIPHHLDPEGIRDLRCPQSQTILQLTKVVLLVAEVANARKFPARDR